MEKKISDDDIPNSTGAEHIADGQHSQNVFEDEPGRESGGRRKSVAHNIIENPLKASNCGTYSQSSPYFPQVR